MKTKTRAFKKQQGQLLLTIVLISGLLIGQISPALADDATTTITNSVQGDVSSTTTPSDASSTDLNAPATGTDAPAITTSTTPDGNGAGSSINTGDAVTAINISNVVNTTLINSDGLISLLNLFAPLIGNVNLSMFNFQTTCALCSTGSITATNNNSTTINNSLAAGATTGNNTISNSGSSTASITTGNAEAAGNLINIANSNFINSNYLLLVMNNFSSMNGDIILPGQSFFNAANSTTSSQSADGSLTNNNTSTIANGLDVNADTGGNTATGTSTVTTGAATAISNAINLTNTNITASEPIFILVRVFGTWNGNILGTPPGLFWTQTPDGLLLAGSETKDLLANSDSNSSVTNNNAATVQNDVHVYALTGANKIDNSNGSASISTGNATAVGNTINIVNTNIVGQNVLLALINIFGNWQGNLTFGAPDVWVGAQADVSSNPLIAGAKIHYHITVANRGSATATNIKVTSADMNAGFAEVSDSGTGAAASGTNALSWTIPSLAAGASRVINFEETMDAPASNPGQFSEQVSAVEQETDANMKDNTDTLSFATGWILTGNQHGSELRIAETNSATTTLAPGSIVHYNLNFTNTDRGGIAYGTTVRQTLYDPMGNIVGSGSWPIGRINPGDIFGIKFDIQFPGTLHTGYYISKATLEGTDAYGFAHAVASSSVYIVNPADQQNRTPTIVNVPAPKNPSALKKATLTTASVRKIPAIIMPVNTAIIPTAIPTTAPLTALPSPAKVDQLASMFSGMQNIGIFLSNTLGKLTGMTALR